MYDTHDFQLIRFIRGADFKTNFMELKKINSRINLLKAQIDQLSNSGLFSEEEVERLSKQYSEELKQLERQAAHFTDMPLPDVDVHDAEILDPNKCY